MLTVPKSVFSSSLGVISLFKMQTPFPVISKFAFCEKHTVVSDEKTSIKTSLLRSRVIFLIISQFRLSIDFFKAFNFFKGVYEFLKAFN